MAAEPVGEALEAHLLSCLGGWILGFDGLFVSVSVVILPLLAGSSEGVRVESAGDRDRARWFSLSSGHFVDTAEGDADDVA